MARLRPHLRNTLLAGLFAAVPLAVTVFLIVTVEDYTRFVTVKLFGRYLPVVGVIIVVVVIYLIGLAVRSVVGKWFLKCLDNVLTRVPLLKELYGAWKQVSFTPNGGEGMYAKVVLVPSGEGDLMILGFTSGLRVTPDSELVPVFVPNVPNPITGRLYLVNAGRIRETPLGTDEAFKILLSSGNYVPRELADVVTPAH